MSSVDALILCIAFAAVSLLVVSYVNRSQMRRRLISQKIEQMKRRINDLEEMSVIIEPLLENKSIVVVVLDELIDLINRTRRLDPKSNYLEANLINAEERLKQLHAKQTNSELWRMLSSDAAIARARYALNETGRILRKRQTLGELTPGELQMHITDLAWTHSMVSVISLVGEGHQAVNRGDMLKAYSFYKSAQQVLLKAAHNDDRRHQFIKELSDILNNKRKAISPHLMPETDYNPGKNTGNLIIPDENRA